MKKLIDPKMKDAAYDSDLATTLVKTISDELRAQLVGLGLERYKYGVSTIVSERRDHGLHVAMRNFWDSSCDNTVSYEVSNETMTCLCTIVAAYFY